MKKWLAGLLAVLILATGASALAKGYEPAKGNAKHLGALLTDLLNAYETPSEDDEQRIHDDLEAIRGVNEADYEIALQVAVHWRSVYLNEGYPLYRHSGGERAEAMEQAGIKDGDIQAIVVLGYALENGEMTRELMGRCDAAAAVARSFPGAILVCSGGATGDNNPQKHTEAGLMKAYLTEQCGIDAARIYTDERAMTTVDNAVNTFAILRKLGVRTMTIVTSTYHQRWGQAIYNAVGAIYGQQYDYSTQIVGNYCFEIEPSDERYRNDAQIAVRQLAQVLSLPRDALDGMKR